MDKKHEDLAMVAQIDKTSVFQEGIVLFQRGDQDIWSRAVGNAGNEIDVSSTRLQPEPHLAAEMQSCTWMLDGPIKAELMEC